MENHLSIDFRCPDGVAVDDVFWAISDDEMRPGHETKPAMRQGPLLSEFDHEVEAEVYKVNDEWWDGLDDGLYFLYIVAIRSDGEAHGFCIPFHLREGIPDFHKPRQDDPWRRHRRLRGHHAVLWPD